MNDKLDLPLESETSSMSDDIDFPFEYHREKGQWPNLVKLSLTEVVASFQVQHRQFPRELLTLLTTTSSVGFRKR